MERDKPAQGATTPRGRWEDSKAHHCLMWAAAMAETGSSSIDIGRRLGVSPATVARWADPHSGRSVPAQVVKLAGITGEVFLRKMAMGIGEGLTKIKPDHFGDDHRSRLPVLMAAATDPAHALAVALADNGVVDAHERPAVIKAARRGIKALQGLVATLEAADAAEARN